MAKFTYKSFCWSVGTTSFRTVNFNLSIENQLALLDEFKTRPENIGKSWQCLQESYYEFMQNKNFVKGNAPNPAKDAREKTSGLVDIGLLDSERNITEVGYVLLNITRQNDFGKDNKLQISNDSYIYLKQMLKMYNNVDGNIVRPLLVFLYVVSKLKYLTKDEFTYLLPLCINEKIINDIVFKIKKLRAGKITIDAIIIEVLMKMENYVVALDYFCKADIIDASCICEIGMNRKSKLYDKPYYWFYKLLRKIILEKDDNSIILLLEYCKKINGNSSVMWRKYLFKTIKYSQVKIMKYDALNSEATIFSANNDNDFRKIFFEQLHLFKAKSTLKDYYDLNRRYFKTTDMVIFADSKVELDIVPNCYFNPIADKLITIAFEKSGKLQFDIDIEEIEPCLRIDEKKLYLDLEKIFGVKIKNSDEAKNIISDERCKRFDKLIDERFNREVIIDLLCNFEERKDSAIRSIVTDNADIPTIFEYVLGIAWYLISNRKGNILDYMKLSLEADLLPKTHASGGGADIEYLYEKTDNYSEHCLLIEATLSDKTNQRRMEMEPVSRHLGDYILKNDANNSYCLFVSTFLNINVISDFRNRKTYKYYSATKMVKGLKILPLQTSEIKMILKKELNYQELYIMFDRAYHSLTDEQDWYEMEIKNYIGV